MIEKKIATYSFTLQEVRDIVRKYAQEKLGITNAYFQNQYNGECEIDSDCPFMHLDEELTKSTEINLNEYK